MHSLSIPYFRDDICGAPGKGYGWTEFRRRPIYSLKCRRGELRRPQTPGKGITSSSSSLEIAQKYFDAWIRRDAEGILATFAPEGTYLDPSTVVALTGQAIAGYARGLWEAFPDLTFDVVSVSEGGDGLVAAQWLIKGTNTGSMLGLPPTGKSVEVAGADLIQVEDGKIRSVRG